MKKYCGNKKGFVYLINASLDNDKVSKIVDKLTQENYLLSWEDDEGFKKASLVLCFVSNNLLNDENKIKELNRAFEYQRNVLPIFIEEVTLTSGLNMLLGATQGIFEYKLNADEFAQKLLNSPSLVDLEVSLEQKKAEKKKVIGIITILISALIIFIVGSGIFKMISKNSLLGEIGITGRINSIKKIYLYGDTLLDEYNISYIIDPNSEDYDTLMIGEGRYNCGNITDVADFAVLTNLEELCLAGNKIRSIEPLLSLKKLRLLDLSSNPNVAIEGISSLKSLEIINLANTNIEDYSELLKLENLKKVYVSSTYFDLVSNLEGRNFNVISVETIVRTYEALKEAMANELVYSVDIAETIIIPEGETLTLRKGVVMNILGKNDPNFYLQNDGTLIIEGYASAGACTRYNNGTIIIKDGGVYSGGMCNSENNGTFTIEEGGKVHLERAHQFYINGGKVVNSGDIYFKVAAGLYFNDGIFINNGNVYFNSLLYGGIKLNGTNFLDNGAYYFYDGGEENTLNPIYQKVNFSYLLAKSFAN